MQYIGETHKLFTPQKASIFCVQLLKKSFF